ncbi:MAG: phosphate ABC transporter ATP-binding protein PstB [Chloroflexota bacterium]|nr:phosphate ABC transporter ATP-binding protein PstB [Chloroflexota bacterium]MDE2909657.1 phosphate ABC transporter ATP-binding protein PstB [Chloroflexota bacterium]
MFAAPHPQKESGKDSTPVIELRNCSFYYGALRAVAKVSLPVYKNRITALIGPSGCGKSTVLRGINRMLELTPGARVEGEISYRGMNLYAEDVDPVEVRRRIGMVFQNPNPFPKSIFDNVAYGPRLLGVKKKGALDEIVERSLRGASLWDEVSGDLNKSGLALSGGQQQRLCIARAIAVEPDVILMDEPCSALDPIATQRIEEMMRELQRDYTIVIVTHNMQQAQRASDFTAFFNIRKMVESGHEVRWGELVEYNKTSEVFESPALQETADYIAGRFG